MEANELALIDYANMRHLRTISTVMIRFRIRSGTYEERVGFYNTAFRTKSSIYATTSKVLINKTQSHRKWALSR